MNQKQKEVIRLDNQQNEHYAAAKQSLTDAAVSISKLIGILGTSDKNLEERTKLQNQKTNIESVIGEYAVKLASTKEDAE